VKSPQFLGQVLALCLPGLIAVVPAVQARSPQLQPTRPVPSGSVSIRHREVGQYRQSVDTSMVMQVRWSVDRALALQGPELTTFQRVKTVLSQRYGTRMLASSAAPGYAWMWNPVLEKWVLVCLSTSTIEIDFGRRGTVVIETTETMPVD
jgi:hypothetical protein